MSDSLRRHPWHSPGKNTGVGCHFLLQCIKVKSESEVAQSCPTLRDRMDCSLPGSSVHGIFQARVLEFIHITWFKNQRLIFYKMMSLKLIPLRSRGRCIARKHADEMLSRRGSTACNWQGVIVDVQLLSSIRLWSHGLQHARLSCSSLPPRVYSNSCWLSHWCHPTISSSATPCHSCPQSLKHQGLF